MTHYLKNRGRICVTALVFLCAALLHASLAFGTESAETNLFGVGIYTNTSDPDSHITQYHFVAGNIEWIVFDRAGNPKPKNNIWVFQYQVKGSFLANAPIHKAIMRQIFSRWHASDFDSVEFYGPIGGSPDWLWEIPIDVASSKSDDYKDFKAHYPHSRLNNLYGLYKQFVDENKVYQPIQEVFREFGADIEFEGGEKHVLNSEAENLPFYPQLKALGINGKTRVIYDALGNWFTMKPWPNKPVQSAATASN